MIEVLFIFDYFSIFKFNNYSELFELFLFSETDRSKVSLEVFESIVKQTPQFQLAKDSCTFYVSNLFGSSADPKEATREVFDNLKGNFKSCIIE